MCICMHIYTHVHTCIYIYIYICIYIRVYIHIFIFIHVQSYKKIYIYTHCGCLVVRVQIDSALVLEEKGLGVNDCQLLRQYYVVALSECHREHILPPCALASSTPRDGFVVEFCLLQSCNEISREKSEQISNIPFAAKGVAHELVVWRLPHCPPLVPFGVHVGVHVASTVWVYINLASRVQLHVVLTQGCCEAFITITCYLGVPWYTFIQRRVMAQRH